MGFTRNGARTFLNILHKACQLSHMPGFSKGLERILGPERAIDLYSVWTPLCTLVETLVAADNYFNQVDSVPENTGDEDVSVLV